MSLHRHQPVNPFSQLKTKQSESIKILKYHTERMGKAQGKTLCFPGWGSRRSVTSQLVKEDNWSVSS